MQNVLQDILLIRGVRPVLLVALLQIRNITTIILAVNYAITAFQERMRYRAIIAKTAIIHATNAVDQVILTVTPVIHLLAMFPIKAHASQVVQRDSMPQAEFAILASPHAHLVNQEINTLAIRVHQDFIYSQLR